MPKSIVAYPHQGGWAFDDESVGLKQEPFVQGADEFITLMVARILGQGPRPVRLTFDSSSFPGWHTYVVHERAGSGDEGSGDWYTFGHRRLWLCPALLKYFTEAPQFIFVRVELP